MIATNALELTTAVTALANALVCNRTPEEITVLAGILVQLGDTLATIAAAQALCEAKAEETKGR